MVKQSRKKLRRPKRKSYRKRTSKARRTLGSYRKMIGGDFTQEENQQLLGMGFTQDNIQVLAGTGIGLNIIQISLNQINPATGNTFTPQELIQSVHEVNNEMENFDEGAAVPDQENDAPVAPGAPYDDVDVAPGVPYDDVDVAPGVPELNIEDLAPYSPRSVTEIEGGKRRKTRKSRKQRGGTVFSDEQLTELGNLGFTDAQKKVLAEVFEEIDSNSKMILIRHNLRQIDPRTGQLVTIQQYIDDIADSPDVRGGKRRRKSRKQRGGVCYGNGVGANNYDPNFSIYNTRELTLFPYRPTN